MRGQLGLGWGSGGGGGGGGAGGGSGDGDGVGVGGGGRVRLQGYWLKYNITAGTVRYWLALVMSDVGKAEYTQCGVS